MLEECVMAVVWLLAVIGAVRLVGIVVLHLTRPKRMPEIHTYLCLSALTENPEAALRHLYELAVWRWNRGQRFFVVTDETVSAETKRLAERFCGAHTVLELLTADEICPIVQPQTDKD